MNTNTEIANITEQQIVSATELTTLISTLTTAVKHSYLDQHQLPADKLLLSPDDELYIVLHNVAGDVTGVKQVTGPQENTVIGTGNKQTGFFWFANDKTKLVLLADNYLAAHKAHSKTGYSTVMIGCHEDLANLKSQLTPFNSDTVVIYCSEGPVSPDCLAASLSIETFDLSNSVDFKARMNKTIQRAKLRIPEGFSLKEDGVYMQTTGKDGVEISKWLCSLLKVSALTRDIQSDKWGLYIEMLDSDCITHSFVMPKIDLINSSFINRLADNGLTFEIDKIKYISQYLMKAAPIQRARSVLKTGWYKELFVLPNKVVGKSDEIVVYQNSLSMPCNYEKSGTIKGWRNNVSSLCKGNTRLAFGVSTAFATMLLRLINGESGGFHFRGESSRGKTSILTLAKSVFGNPDNLPRWRSTVNGLEGLASSHNHTLLCLDEFSQLAEVKPKDAGEAIYMLGNGEGKHRTKSNGEIIKAPSWQLLYLSAGEITLQSALKAAKLQTRAGQEVRFIDVPADAGTNLGAFNTVQEFPDGNQFALAIKENSLKYHGTAATAFLEVVTANYELIKQQLISKIDEFIKSLDLSNADPQVYRVAQRFAQVGASGEIATDIGITGWDVGEANNSALACFKSWVDARGGNGSQEAKIALEQVSGKLLSWHSVRFHNAKQAAARNGEAWGIEDEKFLYVYTDVFKNIICQGLDVKTVENTLLEVGVLIPSKSRRTSQVKIEGKGVWLYKLNKKIFEFTSIEAEVEVEVEAA